MCGIKYKLFDQTGSETILETGYRLNIPVHSHATQAQSKHNLDIKTAMALWPPGRQRVSVVSYCDIGLLDWRKCMGIENYHQFVSIDTYLIFLHEKAVLERICTKPAHICMSCY